MNNKYSALADSMILVFAQGSVKRAEWMEYGEPRHSCLPSCVGWQ